MTNETCTPDCVVEFAIHSVECQKAMEQRLQSSSTCFICEQPIGKFSIQTQSHEICIECGNCQICEKQVTIAEINLALANGLPVQHARCRMKTNPNLSIPVNEYELTLLNLCRLAVVPDVTTSIETNQQRACLANQQLWSEYSLEQKYMQTQMIQALYEQAYLAIKRDPTHVKKESFIKDGKAEVKAMDDARENRILAQKGKVTIQEKFLASMIASGVSKEDAIKIWQSQGKTWVE
jgi:hypothetical protein